LPENSKQSRMENGNAKNNYLTPVITAGLLAFLGANCFFINPVFAADETTTQEANTQETQPAASPDTQQSTATQENTTPDIPAPAPSIPSNAPAFSDVTTGNENFVAIKYLKTNNLIDGYEDGTFKPQNEVNRAEALKMILKAIKGPDKKNSETFSFTDVKTTDWFYEFALKAWNNFLVKGYPDGLFHPEKTINLAESLKIILKQEGDPIPSAVSEKPYNDVATDDWYAPYAQIAKSRTLVLESRGDGFFYPDRNLNRGQMSELLYRTIRSKEGSSFARATWYADLLANQGTASGEPYLPDHFTVAHKTLPFGTKLLVTNLANGKSVEVTVNDRGPYSTGVDLDLSKSAFAAIASVGAGIIYTEYKTVDDTRPTNNDIKYGF
jgi:rare lipoprotein A